MAENKSRLFFWEQMGREYWERQAQHTVAATEHICGYTLSAITGLIYSRRRGCVPMQSYTCSPFPSTRWPETLLIIFFFFFNICTLKTTTWRLLLLSIGGACVQSVWHSLGWSAHPLGILGVALSLRGTVWQSLLSGMQAGWRWVAAGQQGPLHLRLAPITAWVTSTCFVLVCFVFFLSPWDQILSRCTRLGERSSGRALVYLSHKGERLKNFLLIFYCINLVKIKTKSLKNNHNNKTDMKIFITITNSDNNNTMK